MRRKAKVEGQSRQRRALAYRIDRGRYPESNEVLVDGEPRRGPEDPAQVGRRDAHFGSQFVKGQPFPEPRCHHLERGGDHAARFFSHREVLGRTAEGPAPAARGRSFHLPD